MNWHALSQHWTHGWAAQGLLVAVAIMAVAIVALYIVAGGITMLMVNSWARAHSTAYAYLLVLVVPLLGYLAG